MPSLIKIHFDRQLTTNRPSEWLFQTRRHDPARPGRHSQYRVDDDDPVEPGHDEFAASTSIVWTVGI